MPKVTPAPQRHKASKNYAKNSPYHKPPAAYSISKNAPKHLKRQARISTTSSQPQSKNDKRTSRLLCAAQVADNKYALLNLLDGEFEEARIQNLTSKKAQEAAVLTKKAHEKLRRISKPVSKTEFDSTLSMLDKL